MHNNLILCTFSIKQTTSRSIKKEKLLRFKQKTSLGKPIMLSYARQEAAQHALDLKRQLVNLGYSVYLVCHSVISNHLILNLYLFYL